MQLLGPGIISKYKHWYEYNSRWLWIKNKHRYVQIQIQDQQAGNLLLLLCTVFQDKQSKCLETWEVGISVYCNELRVVRGLSEGQASALVDFNFRAVPSSAQQCSVAHCTSRIGDCAVHCKKNPLALRITLCTPRIENHTVCAVRIENYTVCAERIGLKKQPIVSCSGWWLLAPPPASIGCIPPIAMLACHIQ